MCAELTPMMKWTNSNKTVNGLVTVHFLYYFELEVLVYSLPIYYYFSYILFYSDVVILNVNK